MIQQQHHDVRSVWWRMCEFLFENKSVRKGKHREGRKTRPEMSLQTMIHRMRLVLTLSSDAHSNYPLATKPACLHRLIVTVILLVTIIGMISCVITSE